MNRTFVIRLAACAVALLLGSPALSVADDVGVTGRKLVMLFNPAASKVKLVYASTHDTGIHKGAAGDAAMLDGTFEWSYTNLSGLVMGSLSLPASNWITNTENVAKFYNPAATTCAPSCVKVGIIKPGIVAKIRATLLDDGTGTGNFNQGGPDNSEGLTTVFTIHNGNDASTHRMCTKFAADSGSTIIYKPIGAASGHKLVAKNGVPTACPSITTTSTTVTTTTTSCPPATAAYCGAADCGEGGFGACDTFLSPLCPQGMTCTTNGTTCGCTGATIPCGDPRLSGLTCNFCKWGTCPLGMTCGGVPKDGACGFDCACH